MNKESLQTYLTRELKNRLKDHVSCGKGRTQSSVIEAALTAYFDDATDSDVLYRRLDRLSRTLNKLSRDQDLLNESFAVFVQLWFAHTPRLPESERDGAQRYAASRFAQFVEHVAGQFAEGHRFAEDLATTPSGSGEPAVPDTSNDAASLPKQTH